jgi:hypothetical protein
MPIPLARWFDVVLQWETGLTVERHCGFETGLVLPEPVDSVDRWMLCDGRSRNLDLVLHSTIQCRWLAPHMGLSDGYGPSLLCIMRRLVVDSWKPV